MISRWSIFAALLILLVSYLSLHDLTTLAVAPATAPPTQFSAERAMQHLRAIAQKPRPSGSPENARVQAYLTEQLQALGTTPVTQSTDPVSVVNGLTVAGPITNILVRLPGTDSTGAVMLVAHFDTVAMGPGAGDDGSSVAELLETIRALKASPPLRNDVIFLFTDGEERCMLGAQAFAAEHPWSRDVRLAFNFEARGVSGPSWMFETGPNNRWLINEFGKAVPHPVTASILSDIYRIMPNITDFQPLKQKGMNGLNFAITGGAYAYHSAMDNVNRIDPGSLQQQGANALRLAAHFGNLDLRQQPATNTDAVFFPLPGLGLVSYSERLVLPLQVALILLLTAVITLGLRRRALTVSDLLKGFLAALGSGVAVGASVWIAYRLITATARGPLETLTGGTYNQPLFDLGFAMLAGTVALALHLWYHSRITVRGLLSGAALLLLLLGTVVTWFVPGASYLFQWPLLVTALALLCTFLAADPEADWVKLVQIVPSALAAILLYALPAYALLLALPVSMHFAVFGLFVLLLGSVTPHLTTITRHGRWLAPATGAVVAVGLLIVAVILSVPSTTRPAEGTVWYSLDADTGHAVWATLEATPDAYTGQFVTGVTRRVPMTEIFPLQVPKQVTIATAPAASLPAPSVTLVDTNSVGSDRTLRLRADLAPEAAIVYLRVSGSELLAAALNGKPVSAPGALAQMGLAYSTPGSGFDLQLTAKGTSPVAVQIAVVYEHMPELLSQPANPRPAYLMPGWDLDGKSLVRRSFRF